MNENESPIIIYLNNLNNFTKIECISEGSFSTVNTVKDSFSGNLYCIKSFEFDCDDQSKRKIFAKFANKLHSIDFPTLIPHQFFSYVDLSNQFFPSFIYPYFEKKSLKNNINELDNTQIMIILIGISEGLRYLHQNNIAHGALEPSNILLDDQFRPILTSYGLGKLIQKYNSIDPQLPNRGSFNYMAPHYIFQPIEEFKSDIYCFGLIVYYLLSKKDPYSECKRHIQIPAKIVSGSLPQIPPLVPNDFVNFMYKCWMQIPQERPTIQDICKEMLKLRLPNTNIQKINQYRDYLKKEGLNPFKIFKKTVFDRSQPPPQNYYDNFRQDSYKQNQNQQPMMNSERPMPVQAPFPTMQPYTQMQPYQKLKSNQQMQPYTQEIPLQRRQTQERPIQIQNQIQEKQAKNFLIQNQSQEKQPQDNLVQKQIRNQTNEEKINSQEQAQRHQLHENQIQKQVYEDKNEEQNQTHPGQDNQIRKQIQNQPQERIQNQPQERIQSQENQIQNQPQERIQNQIQNQPQERIQSQEIQIQTQIQNPVQNQPQENNVQAQIQEKIHQQIQNQIHHQQQQKQPQKKQTRKSQTQKQATPNLQQLQPQQMFQQQLQTQQYMQQFPPQYYQQFMQQQQQQQNFLPQQYQQQLLPQQFNQHQLHQQMMIQKIISNPSFQYLTANKSNFQMPISNNQRQMTNQTPEGNLHQQQLRQKLQTNQYETPTSLPDNNESSSTFESSDNEENPNKENSQDNENESSSSVVEISAGSQDENKSNNDNQNKDENKSDRITTRSSTKKADSFTKFFMDSTSSDTNMSKSDIENNIDDSDDSDVSNRSKKSNQQKTRKNKIWTPKSKRETNLNEEKNEEEEYSTDIDVDQFQTTSFNENNEKNKNEMNDNNSFFVDSDNEEQNIIKDVIKAQRPYGNSNPTINNDDDFFFNLELPPDLSKLVKSAKSGNPNSQNNLALILINGQEGVFPPNQQLAFDFFKQAADKRHVDAIFNLARCYENGTGTKVDHYAAFETMKCAMENGSIIATANLARYYEEGIGCIIDSKKAADLYKICYQNNFVVSKYARCLLLGIGVDQDPQEAFDIINSRDESSDNGIALVKGMCYEYGFGVEINNEMAIECYNRAIDNGNQEASVQLALLLLSGGITSYSKQKVPSNFKYISSFDYSIKPPNADMNESSSLRFDTTFLSISFNLGPRTDPIELLIDASNTSKLAKKVLADCYLRGVGIDLNVKSAIKEYKNAASLGSLESSARLNLLQIKDDLKFAVDKHNDVALVIYGRLIKKRLISKYSTLSDEELEDEALNYFKIASDNGSRIGMCQYGKSLLRKLRMMTLKFKINQNDLSVINTDGIRSMAMKLIKKSADRKYKGGLYNYGRCILESLGVIKIDNCDNNIILIKNPPKQINDKVQIEFNYIGSTQVTIEEERIKHSQSNIDINKVLFAFSLLRKAADLGNNNSRILLGLLMKHGTFLKNDVEGALKYFDMAWKSGSLSGLYHYARLKIKENGNGSENQSQNKEISNILSELKKSLNWNNKTIKYKAMNYYGQCLILGKDGVRQSKEDAANFFRNASGYPFKENYLFSSCGKACINLGDMMNCGVSFPKNKNEAINCYYHALLLDEDEIFHMNRKAVFQLGMAYFKGKEVDQNIKKGLKFIKFAAENNDFHALAKCAYFLSNGIPGFLTVNVREAFRIYSLLADQNYVDGLLNAGKMLLEGKGVQENKALGIQLIKSAADKGNNEAMSILNDIQPK